MENFTPLPSLAGGILIGLSAALLLLFNGKIAGISGITGSLWMPKAGDIGWRLAFVTGLLVGGVAIYAAWPSLFAHEVERSVMAVGAAGLLVGFGTRLGNGCTSGHGICGLGRLSVRSVVSVGTFMMTGALAVYVINHMFGGAL
jgi:uncharacterized membrane protein YedE/YeeE